jgi:hypothetical protein
LTWENVVDVGASSYSILGNSARKLLLLDAGRIATQLGTPRGRYDEYSSKFSLSNKPRFISLEKSQTPEGDAD